MCAKIISPFLSLGGLSWTFIVNFFQKGCVILVDFIVLNKYFCRTHESQTVKERFDWPATITLGKFGGHIAFLLDNRFMTACTQYFYVFEIISEAESVEIYSKALTLKRPSN